MNVKIEFGSFLKGLRETQMISQDQLAENCGLLRHQIISIEKGKNNYTIDNLLKYLHGLQIDSIDLKVDDEIFEFEITGSTMTLNTIREKVAETVSFHHSWDEKLDETDPGHYGINDSEVELSSDDVFVNIPQRTFEFKNANFYFNLNLMSSKDGVTHKDSKVANGSGTFRFLEDGNDIEIEVLDIEVDLDLMV